MGTTTNRDRERLTKISVKDGLIFYGGSVVGVHTADMIARANGYDYAERFVKANDKKILDLDPVSLVIKPLQPGENPRLEAVRAGEVVHAPATGKRHKVGRSPSFLSAGEVKAMNYKLVKITRPKKVRS